VFRIAMRYKVNGTATMHGTAVIIIKWW